MAIKKAPVNLNPEKDGLYLDNGDIVGCNGNKFARTIIKNFDLILTDGDRFYLYTSGVYVYLETIHLSRKLRKFLHRYQQDCWTEGFERVYMAALRRVAPYIKKMDAKRGYLNVRNGMVGLKTFTLYEHDPTFRSAIQLPILYDPKARCPIFLKMLDQIFLGDKALIAVVQEMFGYCLTTSVSAQKFFLLIGEGSNGKSTLIDCLKWIVGKQNYCAVPLKDLNNSFQRYALVDKLLNVVTENEADGKGFNSEALKAITTGDSIMVEQKYHDAFPYEPYCKMAFAMNEFAFSRDHTLGLTRRIVTIPFRAKFKDSRSMPETQNEDDHFFVADKDLKKKLATEKSGILTWALHGLKRLNQNGMEFTDSEAVRNLGREYREEIDPTLRFVREHIRQGTLDDRITNNDLRETFNSWANSEGHSGLARKTATKIMADLKKALSDNGLRFQIGKSEDRFISGIKFHLIRRRSSPFDEEEAVDESEA